MRAFLLLCMLLLVTAIAGCGGDDETTVASRTATESAPTDTVEQTTTEAPTTTTEAEDEPAQTTERDDTPTTEEEPPDSSGGGNGGSSGGETGGGNGGGSGGSSGDEQAAQATALAFLRGLSGGDGAKACGAMSDQIRQQIEKTLGKAAGFKGKDCAGILTTVSKNYPDEIRQDMGDIRVLSVTVTGQTASVSYQAGSLPKTQVPLVRVDGEWKVGALAAPGQTGQTG